MIEGGSSRNYVGEQALMYASAERGHPDAGAWPLLVEKLLSVLVAYAAQQVEAGADVIQIFDSWAGALSIADYTEFCLPATTELVRRVQGTGACQLFTSASIRHRCCRRCGERARMCWGWTGAWILMRHGADWSMRWRCREILIRLRCLRRRICCGRGTEAILRAADGRPGHIFNLGHGLFRGRRSRV